MRFLADHNFHAPLLAGVLRRESTLSIVTAREVGLDVAEDPELLEWAAQNKRVVLSHEVQTLEGFAYERVGTRSVDAGRSGVHLDWKLCRPD